MVWRTSELATNQFQFGKEKSSFFIIISLTFQGNIHILQHLKMFKKRFNKPSEIFHFKKKKLSRQKLNKNPIQGGLGYLPCPNPLFTTLILGYCLSEFPHRDPHFCLEILCKCKKERLGSECKTFRTSKNLVSPGRQELHMLCSSACIKINVCFHPTCTAPAPDRSSKSIPSQVRRIFQAHMAECMHTHPRQKQQCFNALYGVSIGSARERRELVGAGGVSLHLLGCKANTYFHYCLSFCRTCHTKNKGATCTTASHFIPYSMGSFE